MQRNLHLFIYPFLPVLLSTCQTLSSTPPVSTPFLPTPTSVLILSKEVDGMITVFVPAGKFLMGSSDADAKADSDKRPQYPVYLDAYWIDRYAHHPGGNATPQSDLLNFNRQLGDTSAVFVALTHPDWQSWPNRPGTIQ